MMGATGSNQATINFEVGNAAQLSNSKNVIFNNLAGYLTESNFIWGLPFFLGRKVYIGVENNTSDLGTGPYWGFLNGCL